MNEIWVGSVTAEVGQYLKGLAKDENITNYNTASECDWISKIWKPTLLLLKKKRPWAFIYLEFYQGFFYSLSLKVWKSWQFQFMSDFITHSNRTNKNVESKENSNKNWSSHKFFQSCLYKWLYCHIWLHTINNDNFVFVFVPKSSC